MKFIQRLLEPSYSRHADFHSLSGPGATYSFECSKCTRRIAFPFSAVIGNEYAWAEAFSKDEVAEIRSFFQMNLVGKSMDGGRPAILLLHCVDCEAEFLIYAGVAETSNSVYRVVVQSIVEVSRVR